MSEGSIQKGIDFVGREAEMQYFRNLVQAQKGVLWLVQGAPGIGKSRLLKECVSALEVEEYPHLFLDLRNQFPEGGEALLRELCNKAHHTPRLENLGQDKLYSVVFELEEYFPAIQKYIELFVNQLDSVSRDSKGGWKLQVIIALFHLLFADQKKMESELRVSIKTKPEETLLRYLAAEGHIHPVLFIDTFEHAIYGERVVHTSLNLSCNNPKLISEQAGDREYNLARLLYELCRVFTDNGWIVVVAGRQLGALTGNIQPHELQRLTQNDVLQMIGPILSQHSCSEATRNLLASKIWRLSFEGNPLWLNAVIYWLTQMLADGKQPEQIAYAEGEFKSEIDSLPMQLNPDPEEIVRCKAEILEKIANWHNFSKEHLWYLALPIRIDEQRLLALFSEETEARKLFQMAELAGLFTACGKTRGFWFLHEEIRDVLLWWAGKNNKLESNETRECYRKLLRVMKNQHPEWIDVSGFVWLKADEIECLKLEEYKEGVFSSDALAWYAEGICYGIMRSENLSKIKLNSTFFVDQLMSSAYFTLYAKWNLANNIEKMSDGSVRAIEYLLQVEKNELVEIIGAENYVILRAALLNCDLIGVSDTAWWLKKIQEQPDNLGWYGGLFTFYDLNASSEYITPEQLITLGKHLGYVYESDFKCQYKVIAARALGKLGALLSKLGQKEEGVKVYDYLISKFWVDTDTVIKKEVAGAMYHKSLVLGEMGQREEAIEVYENMALKYDSVVDVKIQKFIAVALYNKGVFLGEMDRKDEAIEAFENMESKYSCFSENEIRQYVAAALLNKGVLLSKMQRVDKAIEMYDEVVKRFGDTGNMSIQEQLVRALLNKGMQLYQMEQKEESIAVYDELLIRCNGVVEPAILEMVVESFMRKAMALEELDRRVESIAVYDDFIDRFSSAKAIIIQEQVVSALGRKVIQLSEIGRKKESFDVCVEVVERIKEDNNPVFRRPLAEALFYKGFNLSEMGLGGDAIAVYDELVERFGNDVEITIQVQVAKALFNKGVMLSMIGKKNGLFAEYRGKKGVYEVT
jgi:tetratricopeptide (TPR) repeat protein